MISLSWNEVVDIRHSLRYAKSCLHQHGLKEEACEIHNQLEKLNDLIGKHEKDEDDNLKTGGT